MTLEKKRLRTRSRRKMTRKDGNDAVLSFLGSLNLTQCFDCSSTGCDMRLTSLNRASNLELSALVRGTRRLIQLRNTAVEILDKRYANSH